MKITGIICEYNPFHLGHQKQLRMIRSICGEDSGIVCLMSGNFVQRGHPAIVDKMRRAEAAIRCGADLVLELPVTYALSSAEGFAQGGVKILSGFCDYLCFGAETADTDALTNTADALLSEDFTCQLRQFLDQGLSFPAARQAALEAMGLDVALVQSPNNILAVEYCKAIRSLGCAMQPMPIQRSGSYHDTIADAENPSATSLRSLMRSGEAWASYVPAEAAMCFAAAPLHSLGSGERAVLMRLRTMTDADFEALPYSGEGLWRKFMHAARSCATMEQILAEVKSKRYTRTRLDRMLMCAVLGITQEEMTAPAPYTRVLAFNTKGREILKKARTTGDFPNIGQPLSHPYEALETRCGDIYGLFTQETPASPGLERRSRVFYTP